MNFFIKAAGIRIISCGLLVWTFAHSNPSLTPGVWKNITPAGVAAVIGIEYDPVDPSVLYVSGGPDGLFKSTDGGSSWAHWNGNLTGPALGMMRIDPKNRLHMYLYGGVTGTAGMGFWVSQDGGVTWTQPQSFSTGAGTTWVNDVYWIAPDPSDFNHILLTFHAPWNAEPYHSAGNSGVLESKDGGTTWIPHYPSGNWQAGLGVNFLYNPAQGIGNSNTWLVGTQWGGGYYRTSDGGTTWANVTTQSSIHGATQIYYSKTGVLYSGANYHIMRSTDNGVNWTLVGPNGFSGGYYCIIGDGTSLYAQVSNMNNGMGSDGPQPYMTSPETDGTQWAPYNGGTQTFCNGPYHAVFDSANRIIYSATWSCGLWALRVIDSPTNASNAVIAAKNVPALQKKQITLSRMGISIKSGTRGSFSITGRLIYQQ